MQNGGRCRVNYQVQKHFQNNIKSYEDKANQVQPCILHKVLSYSIVAIQYDAVTYLRSTVTIELLNNISIALSCAYHLRRKNSLV